MRKNFGNTKTLYHVLSGILGSALVGCVPQSIDRQVSDFIEIDNAWQGVSCYGHNEMDLLTSLDATDEADGLMLVYPKGVRVIDNVKAGGELCVNASDSLLCQNTVAYYIENPPDYSILITQGDEVRLLHDEAEVRDFLGELDNSNKLFSWMHVHGMMLSCSKQEAAVRFSDSDYTWDAIHLEQDGCGQTDLVQVSVNDSLGLITETQRWTLRRSSGGYCVGRKPPGLRAFPDNFSLPESNFVGEMFARHAAYEAASVLAFTQLLEEMKRLGAPEELLERIWGAARDEERHAQCVGNLALRYGVEPEDFSLDPSPFRDIEAIAIDNMVEGCIGETWGSLVGLYQAEMAADPVVANTMSSIAIDEVAHASLSWAIHDWLSSKLTDEAKQRVEDSRRLALENLRRTVVTSVDDSFIRVAGFPTPEVAQVLVSGLICSIAS